MATKQDEIKQGTLEGAADRLAAMRADQQRDGLIPTDPPVPMRSDGTPELLEPEPVEAVEPELELEAEFTDDVEPPQEIAPADEVVDDLFADDMDYEDVDSQTLEAPAALSKEGKALFAQADPELQKEVAARLKAAERGATQKVQQVVEREKEVEQLAQQVLQMRDEWTQKLESLDVSLPEPPDPDLADINSDKYDPDQFNVQLARYERAKLNVEKQKSERQRVAEEQRKVQDKQIQEQRQEHARRLVQYFPKWNTQESFTSGVNNVRQFLVSEGIAPEVASQITDPDMIKISYMASKYKEIKSKSRSTAPKRQSAPSGRPRTPQLSNAAKARAALKESGSMQDAVAVLSATRRR